MSNFAKLQELLKKKKASLKTAGKTIKPKAGKNRYVILPPWRGGDDMQFWHDFGAHYIKDEADQLQAVYVCASDTFGKPCTICNGLAEAQRTVGVSNPEVAELIKKAKSGMSYLVNVLALDTDTPDDPQVLSLGKNAFGQLVTLMEEWGEQVFDPSNPLIVTIERTGTTVNDTRYTVQPSPQKHSFKKKVTPINLDEFVAQENEEAERKALLAIRSVAGLSSAPRLAAPSKAAPAKAAADAEFEDVPDFPSGAPVATPTAAASKAVASDPALTDDIDDLLSDLQTGT